MTADKYAESVKEKLKNIALEVRTNIDCNHLPEDGSDEPCDGDDCIRCELLRVTSAALALPVPENDEAHCAWLRYKQHDGGRTSIHLCDSDAEGAFRVYRYPPQKKPEAIHRADCRMPSMGESYCHCFDEEYLDELRARIAEQDKRIEQMQKNIDTVAHVANETNRRKDAKIAELEREKAGMRDALSEIGEGVGCNSKYGPGCDYHCKSLANAALREADKR